MEKDKVKSAMQMQDKQAGLQQTLFSEPKVFVTCVSYENNYTKLYRQTNKKMQKSLLEKMSHW